MIEYYLLEQLVAVADKQTISGAAKQLHISQPAISQSMHKIEDKIGVSLFNRSKSHIELNENGKIAVKYARQAIATNQEVTRQTRRFNQEMQVLRVGACTSFIGSHFLSHLHADYPLQKTQLTIADDQELLNELTKHSLDLVILHSKSTNSGLACKHYVNDRLMLILPKTNSLAGKKSLHFSELSGQSILGHQKSNFWLDICRRNIPKLNLIVQDNMATLEQLVFSSTLPAFNTLLVQPVFRVPDNKVTLPIMDEPALVKYYFAYRKADQSRMVPFTKPQ